MSGPTEHKKVRKHFHEHLAHHATRPHGILAIGLLIFLAAWLYWSFYLAIPHA